MRFKLIYFMEFFVTFLNMIKYYSRVSVLPYPRHHFNVHRSSLKHDIYSPRVSVLPYPVGEPGSEAERGAGKDGRRQVHVQTGRQRQLQDLLQGHQPAVQRRRHDTTSRRAEGRRQRVVSRSTFYLIHCHLGVLRG